MGIMLKCLRLALPKGKAIRLILDDPMVKAIAAQLECVRSAIYLIPLEANPGTATYTLPEWHEALGQKYDPTRPIADQRARLEAQRLVIGGMTQYQLQEQINKEFLNVTVSEVSANSECGVDECGVSFTGASEGDYSPQFYDVTGSVGDEEQLARLATVFERFAPFHLTPCSTIDVEGLSVTSECGVALCGVEETGA